MPAAQRPSYLAGKTETPIGTFRRATRLLLIGWFVFSIAGIALAIRQSIRANQHDFEQAAEEVANEVTDRALIAETALEGFSAFVMAQPEFDHATAADYARTLSSRYPFLYKFEVAQQIDHTERAEFEQRLSAIYPGYEVLRFDYENRRQWHEAAPNEHYFPIIFQEPYFSDERQIVGLDLNSSVLLIEAMQMSYRLGLPMATRPFVLAENVIGFVIHRALDGEVGRIAEPLTSNRYALLALRADRLYGELADRHPTLAIRLTDADAENDGRQVVRLIETAGQAATPVDRLLLPRFERTVAIEKTVPSQPFLLTTDRQMTWRDLNLPLLIGLIAVALIVPLFARRFALAYFENRLAGLRSEGKLYEMANFDALTGVANRHRLIEQLEISLLRAKRDETRFCLLFVDIDGFKAVNDRLGHAAGDAVLVAFCERLNGLLRGDEMLGRLGGDEFVLLTSDNPVPTDVIALIDRVRKAADRPLHYRNEDIRLGVSIGHACYPGDGVHIAALLESADRRMYREKQARTTDIATSET